jgi:hypothetical protein
MYHCWSVAQGVVDARRVPGLAHSAEERLDHGGEQDPVILARLQLASFAHCCDQVLPGCGVELGPELVGCTDDCQGEKGCVDQRLTVGAEVESVGRLGIGAIANG